jgi:hypothetical protein
LITIFVYRDLKNNVKLIITNVIVYKGLIVFILINRFCVFMYYYQIAFNFVERSPTYIISGKAMSTPSGLPDFIHYPFIPSNKYNTTFTLYL